MMYEPGVQAKETPGLEDYLAAIRQRKLLVALCAALGLFAAILFTVTSTNTYEASAKVLVNPTPVGTLDGRLRAPVLEREREVIASNAVARLVVDDLGLTLDPIPLLKNLEVIFVDDSDTLELLFIDEDPRMSQDLANSFAQMYVEKRNEEAVGYDTAILTNLRLQIEELDLQVVDLEAANIDLSERRARVVETGDPGVEFQDQILDNRNQISSLRTERRALAVDLSDATLAQSTRSTPGEVLQFANVPTVPTGFSDNILRALGLILGAGLGAGLAFVAHRLDRTARESADVELALATSALASIPTFGVAHRSGSASVVMLAGGRSPRVQQAREAFRRLRSSMQFLGSSRNAKSFLITSARPTEGKSTIAVNLAVALAQSETKVCLVNADMRRPTLEKVLGVANQQGLSSWLNDPTVTGIMVPVPGTPGLVLVPSGPPPTNPGELLAGSRFSDLIGELVTQFDIVLVDAPPVLSAADASTIATSVDGTLIVVDASRTDTDTLLRVGSEIDRAGGTIVGAILNRDTSDSGLSLRKNRYAYEKVSASRAQQ